MIPTVEALVTMATTYGKGDKEKAVAWLGRLVMRSRCQGVQEGTRLVRRVEDAKRKIERGTG